MSFPPALEQISISLSLERKGVTKATCVSARRCDRDHGIMVKDVSAKAAEPWALNLTERFPPFQMCISHQFADHVRQIHKLLKKALVDIVERWHSDAGAMFPSRMPLETHEEELLRWLDGPGRQHVRPFQEAQGIWRTDFLIEMADDGLERAKICEINARLPYNGCWISGRLSEAAKLLNNGSDIFLHPDNFEETKKAVFSLFDKTQPLCHLREKWPGVDSPHFLRDWALDTGSKTVTIKPSHLRSRKDPSSVTGRSLYRVSEDSTTEVSGTDEMNDANRENSVNGLSGSSRDEGVSINETINQCSIELFQDELRVIDTDTLHQLATCCNSDFRNSLIIHDKRLLCILREELPNLVKRSILTEKEGTLLKEAIIETIIPGSTAMHDLLNRSRMDDDMRKHYIIKPVRDGNGDGIRLGRNITQEEWLEALEHQASKPLRPSEDACVVQLLVDHVWYDIATHYDSAREVQKCHAVGSYHMIGAELGVFGPWRLGKDVNLGQPQQGGKAIIMCCVMRPEGWPSAGTEKEEEEEE